MKLNVLVLYSASEYPFRRTFKAFLDSFRKYSNHNIFYVNYPFFFPKKLLSKTKWDLVIYTHSFTAPWNRKRYLKKLNYLQKIHLQAQTHIAFFQDEYINTDLINLFIEKMNIDYIYSVAPESEWGKIYPKTHKNRITQYLTGYIDDEDIEYANSILMRTKKDISVSYRTAYPGPTMWALGELGWLKFAVAEFGKRLNFPSSDIEVGKNFLTGKDWFKFLARSQFTLGVPSGSSILDINGSVADALKKRKEFSRKDMLKFYNSQNIKQDFGLEVISPRIFEAGLFNCCQVLVEGNYNNLLIKDTHYIPISRELSNIEEVKEKMSDKEYVHRIINNFKKDIIFNTQLHYKHFMHNFFSVHQCKNQKKSWTPYLLSILHMMSLQLVIFYQFFKQIKSRFKCVE